MKIFAAALDRIAIAKDLVVFFWQKKVWWTIPVILLLLLLAVVLVLAEVGSAVPFVYPLI